MNGPTAFSRETAPAGLLGSICLAHLEQEESLLGATREALQNMRAALIQGDLATLTEALARQDTTVRAGQEINQARARLRQELAAVLGVEHDAVTVARLAMTVPGPLGQLLTRSRERLQALAAEVDQLNRGNAMLVRFNLDFLQRLLVAITGGEPAGHRYGPQGIRQDTGLGTLVEARG